MPLERKILLSVLLILFVGFGSYLIFADYYPTYKDAKKKISYYTKLIERADPEPSEITLDKINILKDQISFYENKFFTTKESDITTTTPLIKEKLLNSGLKITQFQGNRNSVLFSINGSKKSLLYFFYNLSLEGKMYDFPQLNIKMIDNFNFQGTLEVSRPTLKEFPREESYIEEIFPLTSQYPFDSGSLNPMGLSVYVPKKIEAPPATPEPVIKSLPNRRLNKFSYVGLLKKDGEIITMFKENENGRIFRFTINQTISGWKYLGEEDNKFLFTKDDIIYEVIP